MRADISGYLDRLALDRGRAPSTVARYRALLGRFAAFVGRELGRPGAATSDVDRVLVEGFVRGGGTDQSISAASTRNVRLAALRGFFGHLAAEGCLRSDPTSGVRAASVKSRSPGYLTGAEFARLCGAVRVHATEHYAARDLALLALMLHAGLRISEALSIDLSQIDLEGLIVRGVLRKGRTREDVAINAAAAEAIRRWLVYRPSYRNVVALDALFLSDRGQRLSARAFQRSFRRYVVLAGLAGRSLTPHSLRHSCATALYERGVGIELIAKVLNHKKLDTTLIYARIASARKQEAVARLSNFGDDALNSGEGLPIRTETPASGSARKGSSPNREATNGTSSLSGA